MIRGAPLEPFEVPAYLIDLGLIDPGLVRNGDISLVDVSSRNRNYLVQNRRGPSFFLKQAVVPGASATLAREAAIYRLFSSSSEFRALRPRTPSLLHHDAERSVLVLSSHRRAESLAGNGTAGGSARTWLGSQAGKALAVLHRRRHPPLNPRPPLTLPRDPAWVLSACSPELRSVREMSAANLDLTRMAQQQSDLAHHLAELRREWRAECVIHGDLKSSNLLVTRSAGRRVGLWIVDWELTGWGDPCWDSGSILADVLASWLATAPVTGATPPERIPSLTRYRLSREFPRIRAFWASYVRFAGLGAADAPLALVRSVQYAAARLLQTAFEHSQTLLRPSAYSICLLQLSRNILAQPHAAAALLFGLKLGANLPPGSVPTSRESAPEVA